VNLGSWLYQEGDIHVVSALLLDLVGPSTLLVGVPMSLDNFRFLPGMTLGG